MKHYKITKRTFTEITNDGTICEHSKFRPFKRFLWIFWIQLQTYSMFADGSVLCGGTNVAFDNITEAEKFINKYHHNRHRIGSYTTETVEKIALTN